MTQENSAVVPIEEREVEFVPEGALDSIRLNATLVQNFIAVPTASGKLPTVKDCIKFVMLCKGKKANPFEGDVFMIGYDSQKGPSFSMVCGIELFFKRAESSENYTGRESGIIVQTKDEEIIERPGCLCLTGEKLLGGWAKVYRSDRSHPEYKTVNFSVYDTGRSRWKKDPAGQIEKVALSQALRQAFPTLGGLYTQQEMERVTQEGDNLLEEKEPVKMPTTIGAGEKAPETTSKGKTDQTDTKEWVCAGCGVVATRPSPYCESCGLYKGEDPETGKYADIKKGKSGELNL